MCSSSWSANSRAWSRPRVGVARLRVEVGLHVLDDEQEGERAGVALSRAAREDAGLGRGRLLPRPGAASG